MSKYYRIREDQLQKLVAGSVKTALDNNDIKYAIEESNDRHYIVAVRAAVADNFIKYHQQQGYCCECSGEWEVFNVVIPERDPTGITDDDNVKLLQAFCDNDISDDKD